MTTYLLRTGFHAKVEQRRVFWKAYIDWLATASDDETNQLERALAPHAHHVRPLQQALLDALEDAATAPHLPKTLLAKLHTAGWTSPLPATMAASAA